METHPPSSGNGSHGFHIRELFGWCTPWRSFGIIQFTISLIALSLSLGIWKPGGPVTLSQLPAEYNRIWLLTFIFANSFCLLLSMAGVARKSLLQKLQRHPTMFRFWLLADSIILLAMITTIIGYVLAVMMGSDGCRANKQGCNAATAMMVFECLWCLLEIVAFCLAWPKYRDRQESKKGGSEVWIRAYQIFLSSASTVVALFSFFPNGIPLAEGMRTGFRGGLLVVGVVVCGVLCTWHIMFIWPCMLDAFKTSYGMYNFFIAVEWLALFAPIGIFGGFLVTYLMKGTPCYPISIQWCYLIAVTDGFTLVLGALQIYHLRVIWLSYRTIMPPLKREHERKAKERRDQKMQEKRSQEQRVHEEERQIQAHQYSPPLSKPETAHLPREYEVAMVRIEDRDRQHPEPESQHYATNQSWRSETGASTSTSHQTSSRRKRRRNDYAPPPQRRNEQSAQQRAPLDSARPLPEPTFTHPSAPNLHHQRSTGKTSRGKQISSDPAPPPRSSKKSPSSSPGAFLTRSIQRTATGASSHQSRRYPQEHLLPEVSPLSSYEDLSRLTPRERALREPSLCSTDRPPIPVIAVTPCGSHRNSMASQPDDDLLRTDRRGRTSGPGGNSTGKYGHWYSPSDAGYDEVSRPRAGQTNTPAHTDDGKELPLPGVRMIEAASPPPYEREKNSKVWDWMGKT